MHTRDRTAGRGAGQRAGIPAVRGIPRPSLLRALDEVDRTRLGLVVGIPGAGTTTLMAQWADTTRGDVAWYRLERADAPRARFLPRLAHAFGLRPDGGAPGSAEELAWAVGDRGRPVTLVLDDFHHVVGAPAEREVAALLSHAPEQLRVLIGSHTMPTINFACLEIPTPVLLTTHDLRLRTWEVEHLVRGTEGQALPPEDVAELTRQTEGWAAALHLFAASIATSLPADRRRAVKHLATSSAYAGDYLDGQVLSQLPVRLRAFLREVSVFDQLTAERCDALLDVTTSRDHLRETARLLPLLTTDDGTTYRLHRVLHRHLLARFAEHLGPARTQARHRRAAAILRTEGATLETLRALCRAADFGAVDELVRGLGAADVTDTRASWAHSPDADPWPRLTRAHRALADGRLDEAAALAADADPGAPAAVRTALSQVAAAARVWDEEPTDPPRWQHVVRDSTRHYPLSALQSARVLRGAGSVLAEGVAMLLAGDRRAAAETLHRAAADPSAPDAIALAARLAEVALTSTRATLPSSAAVDHVQVQAEQHGLTWLARIAQGIVIGFDGDEAAHTRTRDLVDYCDRIGDRWGAALIGLCGALSCMRAGHTHSNEWDDLILRFHGLGAGVLEVWARSYYALAVASEGLPGAADEARAAESCARAAGVPGALALAYAALADTHPDHSEELYQLATSTAAAEGLGTPPWELAGRRPAAHVRAPEVEVRCFGEFRIAVHGREVDLSGIRPRARTVLRLLALHAGRPVHREQLAEALWSELDPAAAMHNLQVSVSTVRRALEPDRPARSSTLLVRDGEAYALRLTDSARCDILEFEGALRDAQLARDRDDDAYRAALVRALAVYTGDLLPEDGPADWVVATRERYRNQAAEAAAALGAVELAQGRHDAAASAATRSIELDGFRDASWRLLITSLTRAGDTAEAQRAQRGYARMLIQLGLDPALTPGLGTPPPQGRRTSRA